MVPESYIAWHAGRSNWHGKKSLNRNSIGIEISNKGHQFGYQNFTYYPHNLNLFPSTFEEEAKVVPSRLVVIGKAFKKTRK